MLIRNFPDIAVIVDVFPMSTYFAHEDNVHMEPKYYQALATAFPMSQNNDA